MRKKEKRTPELRFFPHLEQPMPKSSWFRDRLSHLGGLFLLSPFLFQQPSLFLRQDLDEAFAAHRPHFGVLPGSRPTAVHHTICATAHKRLGKGLLSFSCFSPFPQNRKRGACVCVGYVRHLIYKNKKGRIQVNKTIKEKN